MGGWGEGGGRRGGDEGGSPAWDRCVRVARSGVQGVVVAVGGGGDEEGRHVVTSSDSAVAWRSICGAREEGKEEGAAAPV